MSLHLRIFVPAFGPTGATLERSLRKNYHHDNNFTYV